MKCTKSLVSLVGLLLSSSGPYSTKMSYSTRASIFYPEAEVNSNRLLSRALWWPLDVIGQKAFWVLEAVFPFIAVGITQVMH